MPYTLTEAKRKKYLSLIHLQKAKAHLDDELYVTLLYSCASVDSAAKITTIQQFEAVVTALNKLLAAQGQSPLGDRNYIPHSSAFLHTVKVRACRILGPMWEQRLTGYLKKIGQSQLEECSHPQLRQVMGFLSAIERGNR
ncbi:MAG: hypothetical protein ACTTI6_02595 [Treponema sp.]|uniref:hypothetical protein n=1 Tax=Treponema sp. TaxID=166 RepID=UPI003FA251A7